MLRRGPVNSNGDDDVDYHGYLLHHHDATLDNHLTSLNFSFFVCKMMIN